MPPTIATVGAMSRTDQLCGSLNDLGILVDLRPALLAAKARERIYFKTDTHWNDRGAGGLRGDHQRRAGTGCLHSAALDPRRFRQQPPRRSGRSGRHDGIATGHEGRRFVARAETCPSRARRGSARRREARRGQTVNNRNPRIDAAARRDLRIRSRPARPFCRNISAAPCISGRTTSTRR